MAVTDLAITLAFVLKFEAPGGDVNLCDGGFLDFDAGDGVERYEAEHPVFGSIVSVGEAEAGFGDMAEGGEVVFASNPAADLADWWRSDLFDSRLRIWMVEVAADMKTATNARLLIDRLVDTAERQQAEGGEDLLALELIGRAEKLFLTNEGNVCSSRFHQTVWPGERGFDNCTDLVGYLAWGTATPSRGGGSGGGSYGGSGGLPGLSRVVLQ
ncbi:hypothetical protein K3172_12900 [Qipengyuania sp. 6B39]|uniref:hypothetical protein n=1 Tax=Qipengyuania proteolytica TaxID=2867239 RepID=UPI001C898BF4|nr:hypothetical protein [Qipengyuania proteolytica]MBX7496757.1 hypothetical protein [Qipengyuania proteolytica]